MTRVHIELQRVQTWLFGVPRLRAMVGANALLGEVLRIRLAELARKQSSWQLLNGAGNYPPALSDDPLCDHDDPASDEKDGILSRDGGHFEANFVSGASEFVRATASLLRRELPGIRFRISTDEVQQDVASVALSTELPVLAPCEWTGRGLGSEFIHQGREPALVSLDVSRRHEAARRAEDGQAGDLASLLVATTRLNGLARAETFEELAGTGYLALIHADGNGVGSTAQGLEEIRRATFFHCNRVLLRCALRTAIDHAVPEDTKVASLQLLMLGGDDLLVVSRAEAALPFVVRVCQELDRLQSGAGNTFKLTLGVGVVFARPTIPIHRLHDVVQGLAASAKRRFRGLTAAERRSVVDWAVYTATWLDDPEEVRRRDWARGTSGQRRVLSQRPVDVLGDGLDSLQGLLNGAETIKDAPRAQLRFLVEQLPKGRELSELAFAELSNEARKALGGAGIEQVWKAAAGDALLTPVLDLVEISEIRRLGRTGTDTTKSTNGREAHAET
jgi:hypothetical protein